MITIQVFTKRNVLLMLAICFCYLVNAQNSKQDTKEDKAAKVKNWVGSSQYVFKAQTAIPLSGGIRQLTGDYELNVSKDTIQAYLPYFGRAYVPPIDPSKGGIQFTSTNFEYKWLARKKGGWDVTIKIKDVPDVRQLNLTISESGYASLMVESNNRQSISFNGEITERSTKKGR